MKEKKIDEVNPWCYFIHNLLKPWCSSSVSINNLQISIQHNRENNNIFFFVSSVKHYFLFPQIHFTNGDKLFWSRVSTRRPELCSCHGSCDALMRWTQQAQDTRMFLKCSDVSAAGPPGRLQRSAIICSVHSAVSLSVLLLFHYTCVCSVHSWDVCGDRPGVSPSHSVRESQEMIAAFIFNIHTKHGRSYGAASVYLSRGRSTVCYCFNNRRCLQVFQWELDPHQDQLRLSHILYFDSNLFQSF